ncbi:plasmid mobilization protein [Wohlfahrtiimonas larvae]|uniref:Uncharacterized protein n=1 Tax=Wohlfahrtiimonas larvae TaxID=1157986 RepID=A0ABP9MUG3_9GAMM|nr:hypothetical protein [Wohlfahrtiimonas larvae]
MKSDVEPSKRTKVINIRVKPEDAEKLQLLANQKGLALSTYCYLLLKNEADQYNV